MPPVRARTTSDCDDILTLPQFEGTCWFNALLTVLFYSDGMRGFFLENATTLNDRLKNHPTILNILDDFLHNNYRKHHNNNDHFYDVFKPENILSELHKSDKRMFPASPDYMKSTGWGSNVNTYLPPLLQFIDVKRNMMFMNLRSVKQTGRDSFEFMLGADNALRIPVFQDADQSYKLHSIKTHDNAREFEIVNGNTIPHLKMYTPKGDATVHIRDRKMPAHIDVLIVITRVQDNVPEIVKFDNGAFRLDSMLISNFNYDTCNKSHMIAGITCRSNKYLYNGERRNPREDGKPCKLIRFDWNQHRGTFCVDAERCTFPSIPNSESNLKKAECFDVKKDWRTYMYVRQKKSTRKRGLKEIQSSQKVVKDFDGDEIDTLFALSALSKNNTNGGKKPARTSTSRKKADTNSTKRRSGRSDSIA